MLLCPCHTRSRFVTIEQIASDFGVLPDDAAEVDGRADIDENDRLGQSRTETAEFGELREGYLPLAGHDHEIGAEFLV